MVKPRTFDIVVVLLFIANVSACSRPVVESPAAVPESKQVELDDPRLTSFGPQFTGDKQVMVALSNLQSPGLGYFIANQIGGHLDRTLDLVYVELPGGQLNRYFALEYTPDGMIQVIDDFVASNEPEITRVHRQPNGKLQYAQSNGTIVVPNRDP